MLRLTALIRNPFSFLFTRSSAEDRVCEYMIREHHRGRSLDDIFDDHYVRNRLTPQQQARLLDRPDLIEAVGHDTVESTRRSLPAA